MDCNTANSYHYHHRPTASPPLIMTTTPPPSISSECREKDVPNVILHQHPFQHCYRELSVENRLGELNRFRYLHQQEGSVGGGLVPSVNYDAKSFEGFHSASELVGRHFGEQNFSNSVAAQERGGVEKEVMVININRVEMTRSPRNDCNYSLEEDCLVTSEMLHRRATGKYHMEANFYMCPNSNEGQDEDPEGSSTEKQLGNGH